MSLTLPHELSQQRVIYTENAGQTLKIKALKREGHLTQKRKSREMLCMTYSKMS